MGSFSYCAICNIFHFIFIMKYTDQHVRYWMWSSLLLFCVNIITSHNITINYNSWKLKVHDGLEFVFNNVISTLHSHQPWICRKDKFIFIVLNFWYINLLLEIITYWVYFKIWYLQIRIACGYWTDNEICHQKNHYLLLLY